MIPLINDSFIIEQCSIRRKAKVRLSAKFPHSKLRTLTAQTPNSVACPPPGFFPAGQAKAARLKTALIKDYTVLFLLREAYENLTFALSPARPS